jgi:putative peptidoglycan lipid II flippase
MASTDPQNPPQAAPGTTTATSTTSASNAGSAATAAPSEERALGKGGVTRAATVFGSATAVSRVLGLVRDMLVSRMIGASLAWSAFALAFAIPNLFRRLFAEGALAGAFVPVFTGQLEHEGRERALRLARTVATALGLVLLAIMAVAWLVFGVLDVLFDSPKMNLIARLGSVLIPYVLFICLAGFGMALLNSFNHFAVPALSPALLNIVLIAALLVVVPLFGDAPSQQVFALAVAVIVGGVVQFGVQLPVLARFGFRLRPLLDVKDPGFRRVLALFLPGVVGLAVVQLNVVVDYLLGYIISDEASAHLYFANRLVQLPLGIFAVALAAATLPTLSKLRAQGRMDTFRATLSYSLRQTLAVAVPAAVGLIVLRRPIVALIYEGGKFGPEATRIVSAVLMFYSLGLFAYATTQVLARAFLAMQDARTPMRIAIAATGLNLALNLVLGVALGMAARGFALATAISSTCSLALLAALLRRRLGPIEGREMLWSLGRIVLASAGMGLVVYGAYVLLARNLPGGRLDGVMMRILLVAGPTAAGMIAYVAFSHALGSREAREFLGAYRRRRTS